MKKHLVKPIMGLLLLGTLSATSCKKEDKSTSPATSRKEQMVGTWTLSKMGADLDNDGNVDNLETSDIVSGFESVYVFKADGTGTEDGDDITWSLTNSDNMLRVVDVSTTTATDRPIKSVGDNTLTIRDIQASMGWWFIYKK
jgi:hypothetical protein